RLGAAGLHARSCRPALVPGNERLSGDDVAFAGAGRRTGGGHGFCNRGVAHSGNHADAAGAMMRVCIRQILPAALLLFGVAACTWNSMRGEGDVARRVYVDGQLHAATATRVAQAAAPYLGVPLFDVDM